MNRRRLELEPLRDLLLSVAGRLDRRMAGPAVEITAAPFPRDGRVYAFIERQNLPGLFRTFDLASPDSYDAPAPRNDGAAAGVVLAERSVRPRPSDGVIAAPTWPRRRATESGSTGYTVCSTAGRRRPTRWRSARRS